MFNNLSEVISSKRTDYSKGIMFINGAKNENFVSYNKLYENANILLKKLGEFGVQPGNEVVFQVDDTELFITLFWACIIGKIIPIPVSAGSSEEIHSKIMKIWSILHNPYLVSNADKLNKLKSCFAEQSLQIEKKTLVIENVPAIVTGEVFSCSNACLPVEPDDIAFIQFSSGSTGDPKGVVLTHRNLITNVYAIIHGSVINDFDSILSWMPLTHDMGLIGNHLVPITAGINNYIMPTSLFIRQPLLWLEKVSQYKTTIISSPNFGYKYYLTYFNKKVPEKFDLSSVRLIFNGAEPISKDICDEFMNAMSAFGLGGSTMFTVYGLAEASLAVTFPPVGEKVRSVILDRSRLSVGKNVKYLNSTAENGICLVELGFPVEGTSVRIVDDSKRILPEHFVGYIEIKGNNVTRGYYNNQTATSGIISKDGWLNTGDLGFMRDGSLVVTGRAKDIIFVNGQNYYSHDLERLTEKAEGIELGKCVAIGVYDEKEGHDEIIIFILYKKSSLSDFYNRTIVVKQCITAHTGLKVAHVLPVKRIPKTTSGKVQRYQLVKAYKDGEFDYAIKELAEMACPDSIHKESSKRYIQDLKPEKQKEAVIALIQEQVKKILGFPITETDKSLVETGIDSIKVPDLQRLLGDIFEMELPVTLVFDYPTLNKMADYILGKITDVEPAADEVRESSDHNLHHSNDDKSIAIIGMGCRFPGKANSPDEFWKKLMEGYDAIEEIPGERWDINQFYDPTGEVPGKMNVRNGGFINDIDMFDAAFFGITPVEAIQMDPQQRLLLEVSWEAMQNAGINIKELEGSNTGVFVGISASDYNNHQEASKDMRDVESYTLTGNMLSTASGRISYTFGFHGPAMSIDTACSSSLVAVHQAAVNLATGQCDLALAGGVNLILSPMGHIGLTRIKALSPEGKCKTFDESADGYVRSEGCGIIVLKRLNEAICDGDNIYAVIKGSTINHDGRSSGLTVPNGVAQEKLIRSAIKQAALKPGDIDYIEAHGTGTKLGDPQEVNALANVFGKARENRKLLIGSVKTNIGHLESAAGIAGLIKVALSLKKGMIPKQIHFNKPNNFIQWDSMPIEVVKEHVGWDNSKKPRIAGVSSFGLSGTNAHVILQETPQTIEKNSAPEISLGVLTISAKKEEALKKMIEDYVAVVSRTDEKIRDICYTSNVSRSSDQYRIAVAGDTAEKVAAKLSSHLNKENLGIGKKGIDKKIAFMFTGQGSQYWGMGRELFKSQPVFRDSIHLCDQLFRNYMHTSLVDLLYSGNDQKERLDQTEYAQPLIFTIEYALFKLWEAFGVKPALVVGHSIGQYVAACAAGVFSLEDAISLVAARGRLMQTLHDTGMMAVIMDSEEKVKSLLESDKTFEGKVSIAAVNSQGNTTISGDKESVRTILEKAEKMKFAYKVLNMAYAFHSPLMKPIVDEFTQIASKVSYYKPNIPIVCDSTGKLASEKEISNPDYWSRHICETVRFYDAVKTIENEGCEIFIEIGSNSVLSGIVAEASSRDVVILPSMRYNKCNWEQLTHTLCQLYINGVEIDWKVFNKPYGSKIVPLPSYPFQKKKYWVKGKRDREQMFVAQTNKIDTNKNSQNNKIEVNKMEKCIAEIKKMINEVSGLDVEDIQSDANLFSFGLDSLMLIQIKKQLDKRFETDLLISRLMDDIDTVEKIANYLVYECKATGVSGNSIIQETMEEARYSSKTVLSNVENQYIPESRSLSNHGEIYKASGTPVYESPAASDNMQYSQQRLVHNVGTTDWERIFALQLDTISRSFGELTVNQLEVLKTVQIPSLQVVHSHNTQEITGNSGQVVEANSSKKLNNASNQVVATGKRKNVPKINFRAVKLDRDIFTDQQKEFIKNFITRYNERTKNSKKYAQDSRRVLSDWIASLNFRMSFKDLIYPIVSAGSQDARFRDVDGNEYIDLAIGYGVHFFGHRPQFVIDAIEKQLKEGYETGPQTDLAGEVASLICDLTGAERVAFCNTGSEAVMAAMRISRTVTKRNKIVIFRGSYHGNFDTILAEADENGTFPISPGTMPGMVEDIVMLNYGQEEALEKIMEMKDELAAVMVEPVQSRNPSLQPKEFLKKLRRITADIGSILIFDEMITGFRIHPGGAQAHFGIKADLMTYGKIVGGGMPIGIVAGKSKFIDAVDGGFWRFGDDSYPKEEMTFFAGTFCKHPISLAASRAVLSCIKENGTALQDKVNEMTRYFVNTINEFFECENVPVRVNYFGSQFRFESFGKYNLALLPAEMDILFYLLMEKGIYTWEKRICFFSTKHTYEDVEYVINTIKASIREMREGGFLFKDLSEVQVKKKLNFQMKRSW